MRLCTIAIIACTLIRSVHAQPATEPRAPATGALRLEVDDCPKNAESLTDAELNRRGGERFERGNTLYLQGDYDGSVRELVGAYCTKPFYTILKDIGQSYERLLEYEKSIAYYQRYVEEMPDDAKRPTACSIEPQVDKDNTLRRIEVLRRLDAHVFVETSPGEATITIQSQLRREAVGLSGQEILVPGGTYEMVVEKVGHVTTRREIVVKIGKPHTYYFDLKPLEGRLSIQTTPADARIFVDKRFMGVGSTAESLPAKRYQLLVEAGGREEYAKTIEVLPNQENRFTIELPPKKQFARRQLIIAAGIGGGLATGSMLYAFENTAVATAGSLAGIGAGLLGSYLYLPDEVPLGTSNLTITTSVAASYAGAAAAYLFTEDQGIIEPILGMSTVLGAGAGYYLGTKTKISPGSAALINSTLLWGFASGTLFAISFDTSNRLSATLTLSGLGMGAVGGTVMARYYSVSRTHAALIDVGGIIGLIGGLAAESLAYRDEQPDSQRRQEHAANFALGGMAIGLIAAGVATRNFDAPKIPVAPALGRATDPTGASTLTYGVSGTW